MNAVNAVLDIIAAALIAYAALPATAFPIIYFRRRLPDGRRAWRSSLYGKALMSSGVSMALLLDFSLLFWTVEVAWAHVVQVVVFALVAVASTLMCAAVVKAGRT